MQLIGRRLQSTGKIDPVRPPSVLVHFSIQFSPIMPTVLNKQRVNNASDLKVFDIMSKSFNSPEYG